MELGGAHVRLAEKARYVGSCTPNEAYILKRNSLRDPMDLPLRSYLRRDAGKFYCQLIPGDDCDRGINGMEEEGAAVAKIELLGQLKRPRNGG
jgi:hypothetical protein